MVASGQTVMGSVKTPAKNPRSETFGYVCNRCLKCCHHKLIQLNPYEIARLARNRDLTTSEFRKACTMDGAGTHLAQTEDGACIFLGDEGCTVHADRPLVCRLYPLSRRARLDGTESFHRSDTHPESDGIFTREGTIGDFLAMQGALPFMQAADEYFRWLCAVQDSMVSESDQNMSDTAQDVVRDAHELLDMDHAIARYSAATMESEPADLEARRQLHLKILHQELRSTKELRDEQT